MLYVTIIISRWFMNRPAIDGCINVSDVSIKR